jgi:archaellum component FlaC
MIQPNQSNAFDYKPKESQAAEIDNQINQLDRNYKLDLNAVEGVDQYDADKLNAYIDQQMALKMDDLKQDVGHMLESMQLEVIR